MICIRVPKQFLWNLFILMVSIVTIVSTCILILFCNGYMKEIEILYQITITPRPNASINHQPSTHFTPNFHVVNELPHKYQSCFDQLASHVGNYTTCKLPSNIQITPLNNIQNGHHGRIFSVEVDTSKKSRFILTNNELQTQWVLKFSNIDCNDVWQGYSVMRSIYDKIPNNVSKMIKAPRIHPDIPFYAWNHVTTTSKATADAMINENTFQSIVESTAEQRQKYMYNGKNVNNTQVFVHLLEQRCVIIMEKIPNAEQLLKFKTKLIDIDNYNYNYNPPIDVFSFFDHCYVTLMRSHWYIYKYLHVFDNDISSQDTLADTKSLDCYMIDFGSVLRLDHNHDITLAQNNKFDSTQFFQMWKSIIIAKKKNRFDDKNMNVVDTDKYKNNRHNNKPHGNGSGFPHPKNTDMTETDSRSRRFSWLVQKQQKQQQEKEQEQEQTRWQQSLSLSDRLSVSEEYINFIDRKMRFIGNYRCANYKCSPEAYYALRLPKNRYNFKLYLLKQLISNCNNSATNLIVNCTSNRYSNYMHTLRDDNNTRDGEMMQTMSQCNRFADMTDEMMHDYNYNYDRGRNNRVRDNKKHEHAQEYWLNVNDTYNDVFIRELEKIAIRSVRYATVGVLLHTLFEPIFAYYIDKIFKTSDVAKSNSNRCSISLQYFEMLKENYNCSKVNVSLIENGDYLLENAIKLWQINKEIQTVPTTVPEKWCLQQQFLSILQLFRDVTVKSYGNMNENERKFWQLLKIYDENLYYIDQNKCAL